MGLTRYRQVTIANGNTINTDFSIEISIRQDLPLEEYIDTILHEMIHYYILYNNLKDTSPHGLLFQAKMNEISSKYGIKVTTAFHPNDEQLIQTISRTRYVCVSEFKDGRVGITVAAKNKIFELWDSIPMMPDVNKVKWYASNRAIFQKFPVSVSPGCTFVDAGIAFHYLTGAIELIRDGFCIKAQQ